MLPASGRITLHAAYQTRGTGELGLRLSWTSAASLDLSSRCAPTSRTSIFRSAPDHPGTTTARPMARAGDLTDVELSGRAGPVPSIGMDMPKLLNAGPVAARIAFFAPVSLVFFVTVVLLRRRAQGRAVASDARVLRFRPASSLSTCCSPIWWIWCRSIQVSRSPRWSRWFWCADISRPSGATPCSSVALPAQLAYLISVQRVVFLRRANRASRSLSAEWPRWPC